MVLETSGSTFGIGFMDSKLAPPFIKGETYFDREGEYVLTSIVRENIEYKRPDDQIERKDAQLKPTSRNIGGRLRSATRPKEGMYWFIAEIIEKQ